MDVVARHIAGSGVSEAQWQACGWLDAVPVCEVATLLAGRSRLVVVSPHPDDEVLACGGLMAATQALGLPVVVMSVTDGEACYPGQSAWPPQRLRRARQQELTRALDCLGVSDGERHALHIDDGAVAGSEAALAMYLLTVLRADDLVLGPWRLDAHPDHEAVGRACALAAASRGCMLREYPVWGWHWLDPQDAPRAWASATRFPLSAPLMERKRAAIAQFSTQLGAVDGLECDPILPPSVVQRFERDYEVLIG
ncbi:LmbE family N-acetylglucosaminyl deacetylase [Stenotrophomonas sp. 2619]|uniref:PIG-L deacetylase family protein n=1 Tax=Stenotrophomonas sp. 2619 TaxID=3156316 RepID=UPI003391F512